MTPFVEDVDFTLWNGDVRDVLAGLPDESVDCCVTSPPYWGLRDYGTGSWDGGDVDCDHARALIPRALDDPGIRRSTLKGGKKTTTAQAEGSQYRGKCGKCGAIRADRQLGLEATPEEYVARMVEVFREVRRVLRPGGTCWLNIGDSYASSPPGNKGTPDEAYKSSGLAGARAGSRYMETLAASVGTKRNTVVGDLKPKNLVGIPWRLAFALQADGWYLRADIIWAKPNPMPESVTDRPTKAHEYLFLLTKSARYFYDADAIREPAEWARWGDQTVGPGSQSWIKPKRKSDLVGVNGRNVQETGAESERRDEVGGSFNNNPRLRADVGRNKRSVWEIATESYPEAHFATFPQALVKPCILAGCPAGGTVLDPFMGSGTTALVARRHGRRSIGIEINADYCALAAKRLGQQSLLAALEATA